MGQIVSAAAKPKRCNLNQLSQVPTPAAGEHILVSSDNSMNAAGQGNFDYYIVGDGTTAATALELKEIDKNDIKTKNTRGDFVSADLVISDDDSNVLVEFKDGHVKTKNFDSRESSVSTQNGSSAIDLEISDEENNVLVRFSEGHIRTKNFNSAEISAGNAYFLNVKDFGAIGNGNSDDTDSLEAAMSEAYSQGKALFFPRGVYIIRRSLTLRNNMEIFGTKGSTIKKKAASTTTLTSDATAGSTTLNVASTTGFDIGDQICISSENSTYPAARHCSVGFVTAVDSTNNTITFVSAYDSIKHGTIKNHVAGCYVTNSFAIFRSWGMYYEANNVEIHDLILDGNRQNGEFGDWMNGCVHIDATTGSVEGIPYSFSASNLTLRDLTIKNSPFDGVSDQGDGGLTMSNCRILNPYMHGVHFGTNYIGAKCISNEITGTENGAAFFWCQNVQDIEVSNNIIKDCYKGCSDYEYGTPAQDSIITNNIFINITNYVFDFSLSGSSFKDKFIISNNLIEDVNYTIANFSSKTKITFMGNVITNFVTTPSYLFKTTSADYLYFIGNIAVGVTEVYSNSMTHMKSVGNSWDD